MLDWILILAGLGLLLSGVRIGLLIAMIVVKKDERKIDEGNP